MTYPAPAPPYLGPPDKHSGTGNKPINRIVLHGTVSPAVKGGARNIARYFRSSSAGGSAHYVIDPGEVVQSAYDSVVCWHAPPNGNSLGVEFCDPVSHDVRRWNKGGHAAELKLGARLVAELCLAYNVPVRFRSPAQLRKGGATARGICEHSDVSAAFKQSSHWDLGGFPRRRFLRMVRAEVAELKGDKAEAAKQRKRADNNVTKARDYIAAALKWPKASRVRKARLRKALDTLPPR